MQARIRHVALATLAVAATLAAPLVQAQENVVKFGVARYTTDSKTTGVTGVGVPAGADAETGDATTALFLYERMFSPNFGIELALGIPPKIDAKATGSVAFLGKVLSAKVVAPTLLFNWHFGQPGDRFRPYAGVGINYTKFVSAESSLAPDVQLKNSWGPAAHVGIEYSMSKEWSLWASVSAIKTKTDLVATGTTVLQTSIDFRPIVYAAGAAFKF